MFFQAIRYAAYVTPSNSGLLKYEKSASYGALFFI